MFCKHKVAVFYYLLKEIRKTPFLTLTLRDYHVDNLFEASKSKIPTINKLMAEKKEFSEHSDVSIKKIPSMINDFKFLLNSYSGFFSSSTLSFKDVLIDTLDEFSTLIRIVNKDSIYYDHYINLGDSLKLQSDDLEYIFQEKWQNPQTWKRFHINIDKNYNITKFETGVSLYFDSKNLKHMFFALFCEFKFADMRRYNKDLQFFRNLYRITSMLISKNALIPQFFKLKNGEYSVRWIPSHNSEVSDLIDNLAYMCPDNLITYNGKALGKHEQVTVAISLFFTGFSLYASYTSNSSLIKEMKNNIYYQLFFFQKSKVSHP